MRCPWLPAPAECFCQARVGQQRGSASTRIGPAAVGTRRLAADGQHIAQPVAADRRRAAGGRRRRPRRRPPTPRGPSRSTARAINAAASAGLVAKPRLSVGIPASSQRSGSSAQELRQIQGAVDQGVPARGGVGQIHRDLGVLDPPGGAGVLALHPDGATPFFTSPVSSTTSTAPGSPKASMT